MKAKRTIRKLTPVARKVAHLTRALQTSSRTQAGRLDALTESVWDLEVQLRGAERMVRELRARDLFGAACRFCDQREAGCNAPCRFGRQVPDLFPETGPGGADPPAQVVGPDPRD